MVYELFFDGFEGDPSDTTYGYADIGTYLTIKRAIGTKTSPSIHGGVHQR